MTGDLSQALQIGSLPDQFDRAWRDGPPPRIEDYAARLGSNSTGRELLAELVQIDLEYRWRRKPTDGHPWVLEDYAKRFPVLTVSAELAGWEYRVRRCWGDQPGQTEYASRFPQHAVVLPAILARIDAELAREQARPVASIQEAPAVPLSPLGQDPRGKLLGPYLLLERLGEGGAGQVFKARHQKMDRLVALKVIRPDLLTDPEAVGRFRREIQVLSALDHPNVVHAYDAGPAGSSYFLAMEYVEGTDLARLVKQCGPLPVMQACAYVRQAALGLQHAHERGLVHRDIKPHNLILSMREGLIKVADLGLARLPRAANEEATAALTGAANGSSLTPMGAVAMGTLDYLAPEQALDFHAANIRADIYSLGCTLWCLLTGQPPFPTGTLAEKLWAHQSKELPLLDKLRPDVPPGLSSVLRRMLAKRPEDRYQAPIEVAEAMLAYISSSEARALGIHSVGWSIRVTASSARELLRIFVRRHKVFSAAVLTALLVLAGSSVAIFQVWRGTERANRKYEEERRRTLQAVPHIVEAARRAVDRQQFDHALSLLDIALSYEPERPEARLLKGQILIVNNQFAQATEELNRYLRHQPGDENGKRLSELCRRALPGKEEDLLIFADVFNRQELPALADGLLRPIAPSSFEARKKLLPIYQDRIEKSRKGWGKNLTLDPAGIFSLNSFSARKEIQSLDVLHGIPLTSLDLAGCTGVKDLGPLKGMPLHSLNLGYGPDVDDLSALKGMPLSVLTLSGCVRVQDLSPLKGMPLSALRLSNCVRVQDLSPLKGSSLKELNIWSTGVKDLTPLRDMPLTVLVLPAVKYEDLLGMDRLRGMKTLKSINYKPAAEFWSKYDAAAPK